MKNWNEVSLWTEYWEERGNKRVHLGSVHDVETVICLCNVDWLSRYNDDWLSEYGRSPWHYSKTKSYLSGCAVVGANGWRAYWDVRKHYITLATFARYYNSMKFADFLLSDAHDDKEGY